VVAGGLQKRGTFVEQVRFELEVDFAKLTGWEPLEGLTGTASVRWRDGVLINPFVGTTSLFSPVSFRSGHGWRVFPFYLTYTTPEPFGIKELLTLSGGWQNPYDDIFAYQPESKFYNILAVVVLQGSNHPPKVPTGGSWPARLPPIPTITSSQWLAATD
jgi:porin